MEVQRGKSSEGIRRGSTRRMFLQQAAGTGLVAVAGARWLSVAEAGKPAAGATSAGVPPPSTAAAGVTPAAEPNIAAQAFDLSNLHASMQATMSAATVAQMRPSWTLPMTAPVSHTPLVDSGRVYFADWGGTAYAVDANAGKILWQQKLQQSRTDWAWYGFAGTGALGNGLLFEASTEGNAFALDPNTGQVKWQARFTDQPTAGNIGTLLYHDGLVYMGLSSVDEGLSQKPGFKSTFRGAVVALDANTGKIAWQRFLVDAPQNGVAIWSGLALDPGMNAVFFSTGNNYTGDDSPLSDSVIAVNAKTGDILWAKQVLKNDVWTLGQPEGPDWDFSGGAQLFEASVNGQMRQLVGAANKSGYFWVFDRRSGDLVWTTGISNGGTLGGMHGEVSIGPDRILAWGNEDFGGMMPPEQHPMTIKALDPATGKILWAMPKAQPAVLKSPGFLSNDLFLIGSLDGKIRAYRTSDGQLLWTSMQHGSISSGLLVQGASLYFTTGVPKIFGDNGLGSGIVGYTMNPQGAPTTPITAGGNPTSTPGTNPAGTPATNPAPVPVTNPGGAPGPY
jgi:polyvinyl alcohol dehydrogenase (cytochrome)